MRLKNLPMYNVRIYYAPLRGDHFISRPEDYHRVQIKNKIHDGNFSSFLHLVFEDGNERFINTRYIVEYQIEPIPLEIEEGADDNDS